MVPKPTTLPPPELPLEFQEKVRKDVRGHLNVIHADEFVGLVAHGDTQKELHMKYVRLIVHVAWNYTTFFLRTWAWTIWNVMTLPMASLDITSQFFWANVSCILLFVLGLSCLLLRNPHLAQWYQGWADKEGAGLSLINSAKPEVLTGLSGEELQEAKEALGRKSTDTYTTRSFNVEIAKLLLICASLMYERPEDRQQLIMNKIIELIESQKPKELQEQPVEPNVAVSMDAGQPMQRALGAEGAAKVQQEIDLVKAQNRGIVEDYAERMGLEFHVISELNSQGTSCCGLFYSPAHNFIILAFKGTSASEFDEWLTDCSFTAAEGGAWIRGFGNVQKGFMDRMFPTKLKGGVRLPYDTIRLATKHVADVIAKYRKEAGLPEEKVNIWFTGHSLGCAMSALAYARANMEPKEFGHHSHIRDGYIFAAPVMCDTRSVNAFNNQLFHNPDHPRALWRITQGRDAVATALPAWGNAPRRRLSPFNMFGFAHLGTEITMKTRPNKCVLSGHHILPGAKVKIVSKFTPPKGTVEPPTPPAEKNSALKLMNLMSYVPVVNRMIDHCPFMYWDQLCRIQHGDAVWDFDNSPFPGIKTLLGY